MQKYLIKNIQIVNEGRVQTGDVLLSNGRIEKIAPTIASAGNGLQEINGEGKYLLPGLIDDQVHFREPGLTHKATIYTEAKAAIAGGVTSFMEMPNTKPPVLTQEGLEEKYSIAARSSLANYSFYMGTSNDNVDEVLRTNEKKRDVCGIKIFMGSSTGNLLVDNYLTLGKVFGGSELLIATHCEDEAIIQKNLAALQVSQAALEPADHPRIRDEEACYESSFRAVQLAMQHGTRLHILHISTEKELGLFTNLFPLAAKRITAEVCVHHLHFTANDYAQFGNGIKCNPAIKAAHHKEALWKALLDDRLDVIATDHAPHLLSEKYAPIDAEEKPVLSARDLTGRESLEGAAGIPLVQHSLLLMLSYYKEGRISLEKIVEKMSHAVADLFRVVDRGYIREGYHADLVIVDLQEWSTVTADSILSKCGWSPFEGQTFPASVTHTFVNGHLVYGKGVWDESLWGQRLQFNV